MKDLGALDGENISQASRIDDTGRVIGTSRGALGVRAFLWTAKNSMTNLGALGDGNYVEALGLNSAGQIVGSSQTPIGARAFVWTAETGMQDLNTLIPTGIGVVLTAAVDITQDGRILAVGALDPNLKAMNRHTETDDQHHAGATCLFVLKLSRTK